MPLPFTPAFAWSGFGSISDALSRAVDPSIAALSLGTQLTGVIAVIGGLSLAAIIVVSALYFQHRKRQMWHEIARLALEKGQPVPPMPTTDEEWENRPPPGVSFTEWDQARRAQMRNHDLKGGLVLIAVGLALFLMLPSAARMAGAIPGFIGVALLINAIIERNAARGKSPAAARPPHS